jgi:uncharacterized protein (TIGR03437 family)
MKKFRLLFATVAAVVFLSCLPAASAQTTTGTRGVLDLTNCPNGGIQVTLLDIFFVASSSTNRGCVNTGAATNLNTGLGKISGGLTGEILNLNVSVCGIFTIPGCVVPDFIRFASQPNLHFDLSLIGPGPATANCTTSFDQFQSPCGVFTANPAAGLPYDSPFYLLQTTTGLAINLPLFGQVRENNTVVASFIGTLSTQEVGTTAAAFQKKILTAGLQQSTFNLSLIVTPVPKINAGGVVNAASNQGTAIAPGEIVTIYGTDLSPVTSGLQLIPPGLVSPFGAGTQVLFGTTPANAVAAPIIYTSPTQISVVVPYGVASTGTAVTILQSLVVASAPALVPVVATAPGIFTTSGSGTGQINAINQDFKPNNAANPAAKGSVVVFYATGEGITTPAGVDGKPTSVATRPVANVSVTVGGVAATSVALEAPGAVAGVLQVNVTIPAGAPSGAAVPVVLTVGAASSPAGTTLAIQ